MPLSTPPPTPLSTDPPAPRLQESSSQQAAPAADSAGAVSWEGFQAFVAAKNGNGIITGLAQARGEWHAGVLTLSCHNGTHSEMLSQGDNHARLMRLVLEYFGPEAVLEFHFEEREAQRSGSEVDREVQANPAVQRVREVFEIKTPGQVTLRDRR